jgi:hypothetical protein
MANAQLTLAAAVEAIKAALGEDVVPAALKGAPAAKLALAHLEIGASGRLKKDVHAICESLNVDTGWGEGGGATTKPTAAVPDATLVTTPATIAPRDTSPDGLAVAQIQRVVRGRLARQVARKTKKNENARRCPSFGSNVLYQPVQRILAVVGRQALSLH